MPHPLAVAVYCGSSDHGPDSHRRLAAALGRTLAEAGVTLVYGGGRIGLMRAVADAAIAAGGEVIGVIPTFLDRREIGHQGVARLEVVASMHERKARMAELADAFVVLPGGLGTLDEAFEIVTWRQLGLHDKPVVVLDSDGYWAPLRALVDAIVTNGYARAEHGRLFTFLDRLEDVLPALAAITGPDQSVDRARL